jgi:hypothetical protein
MGIPKFRVYPIPTPDKKNVHFQIIQLDKIRRGRTFKAMELSALVSDAAQEHGILSAEYHRALSGSQPSKGSKAKAKIYPKTLHINQNRMQIFVSTILSDEPAFGPVLVERKDGNILALGKGKAVLKLISALNERDAFQVSGDDGQPKGGANDKLIGSMAGKVITIIENIGIRVKNGVVFAQEKVSTGRTEADQMLDWVPYEQLVAISLLKNKLVTMCQDSPSDVSSRTQATLTLKEAIMSAADHRRSKSTHGGSGSDTSPSAAQKKKTQIHASASPQGSAKSSPSTSPNSKSKTPPRKKQRTLSAFDQLAASSKKALDVFESVLGARSHQDLLASYSTAKQIQRDAGGEGHDKEIDEEIAFLREALAKALASRP